MDVLNSFLINPLHERVTETSFFNNLISIFIFQLSRHMTFNLMYFVLDLLETILKQGNI